MVQSKAPFCEKLWEKKKGLLISDPIQRQYISKVCVGVNHMKSSLKKNPSYSQPPWIHFGIAWNIILKMFIVEKAFRGNGTPGSSFNTSDSSDTTIKCRTEMVFHNFLTWQILDLGGAFYLGWKLLVIQSWFITNCILAEGNSYFFLDGARPWEPP